MEGMEGIVLLVVGLAIGFTMRHLDLRRPGHNKKPAIPVPALHLTEAALCVDHDVLFRLAEASPCCGSRSNLLALATILNRRVYLKSKKHAIKLRSIK